MATTDRELVKAALNDFVDAIQEGIMPVLKGRASFTDTAAARRAARDRIDATLAPYLALATGSRSEQAALSGWKGDRQGLFAWEVANDARKAAVAALPSLEGE